MRIVIALLFIAAACAASHAQTPLSPNSNDAVAPAHIVDTSAVAVPEPSALALEYHRGNIFLWIADTLLGMAIVLLFLFTGFSAKLRSWAEKIGRKKFFAFMIFFAAFSLINTLLSLPLDYYEGFVRQHAYGLSDQTFSKWIADAGKSFLLSIIFGGAVLYFIYLPIRKLPRSWWIWVSIGAIPVMFFFIMIEPVFIEPMFNDFGPMQDKALEAKILSLATRAGVEGSNVYEVNKSVDTKTLNAYVTGFASTKRIVLWDNIIKKMDDDELLFIMGHEMGHYVLNHVAESVAFGVVMFALAMYLIFSTSGMLLRKFGARFGVTELGDFASLPLIFFLLGFYMFIFSPVINAFSRHNEHEADRFGLELNQNNHAAATAFVKLQTEDLGIPRPEWIIQILRGTHPSLGDRIDFANAYHPWRSGEALKYGDKFVK